MATCSRSEHTVRHALSLLLLALKSNDTSSCFVLFVIKNDSREQIDLNSISSATNEGLETLGKNYQSESFYELTSIS